MRGYFPDFPISSSILAGQERWRYLRIRKVSVRVLQRRRTYESEAFDVVGRNQTEKISLEAASVALHAATLREHDQVPSRPNKEEVQQTALRRCHHHDHC